MSSWNKFNIHSFMYNLMIFLKYWWSESKLRYYNPRTCIRYAVANISPIISLIGEIKKYSATF